MEKRQITVIGLGYVGLTTAVTLANIGHSVVGFDLDTSKVEKLSRGEVPIYEDGVKEILQKGMSGGLLSFTADPRKALAGASFAFICVGTPSLPNGQADLSQVHSAAQMIGSNMTQPIIVVDKSTVPVGTGDKVEEWVKAAQASDIPVDVVSNPEFLREGRAMVDSFNPTRIVIGTESRAAGKALELLYSGLDSPVLIYNRRTAEMIKYASNAFLATKISFINEIAAICDRVGADVTDVAEGMGYDPRIGPKFLHAGVGYGGSCFPKDTSALIQIAGNVFYDFKLLKAVVDVNTQSRMRVVQMLEDALGGLREQTIAVFGLSFKPNTDDIRESPALTIIPALLERGANVRATDPQAMERAKDWFESIGLQSHTLRNEAVVVIDSAPALEGKGLTFFSDAYSTASRADAILLLTEWPEFINLDWSLIAEKMGGDAVIDGRNALSPSAVEAGGLQYLCIGRPNASAPTAHQVHSR